MREGVCSEGVGVRVCGGEATYIVSRQPWAGIYAPTLYG